MSMVIRGLVGVLVAVAGLVASPVSGQTVDPPGFGPVSLESGQVIRMNVFCFEHAVGRSAPSACRGNVMFHDAAGREIVRSAYVLQPGESAHIDLPYRQARGAGVSGGRVLIIPCILPDPGGRAVPSAEVLDRQEGRLVSVRFVNPMAARMSAFNNSLTDPGSLVGFDPQPDPPGFGAVTLAAGETARFNVFCFEHPVNGYPAEPCAGEVMFHDENGRVLQSGRYDLQPGDSTSLEFRSRRGRAGTFAGGIVPCVLPDPGGRVVPDVEIAAGDGSVRLVIGPAVARMSALEEQVPAR